jgi:hypothetical protein
MNKRAMKKHILFILTGVLLGTVISGFLGLKGSDAWGRAAAPAAPSLRLHYQGRLLNPANGQPRADGAYPMNFSLYTQPTGGSPLWTESKTVTVSGGIFSTLLGDTTPLNAADFDQDLWLGITVSPDPQMTPRQPLAYVPYAIYANDADTLDGQQSWTFAAASHTHATLPAAYGYVRFDGVLRPGSYNVDSVTWNNSLDRYEITITGMYYSIDDTTVATLLGSSSSCPGGTSVRASSVSGNLLIYVVASDGTEIQCSFNFVTYAGQ